MRKILFVCHGNICRSPMAEYVMKDLVKKAGLEDEFQIASAATSREEYDLLIGMDRANLRNRYRICGGDFNDKMHLLMEYAGRRKGPPREPREAGRAGRGEARERSEFSPQAETEKSGLCFDEVADPWYTDDFDTTWRDVLEGCQGLLDDLLEKGGKTS